MRNPVAKLEDRHAAPAEHADANRAMFDRIAPSYDTMNRLMSFGIDKRWRKRALEVLASTTNRPTKILDLCAGTLDLSAALEAAFPSAAITACDMSKEMLARGAAKVRRTEAVVGDALALPFADGAFDAVICGFGMRNLADLRRGIREAKRVLKPGGAFLTLELFQPKLLRTRALHRAALKAALPALGAVVAGDRDAYAYLAESMQGFVTRDAYVELLASEGFATVVHEDLTLGVASLVTATTPLRAHANGHVKAAHA